MIIYLDSDYICHSDNGPGRRQFDLPFLDGVCDLKVQSYRYIPENETWNGFTGIAIMPALNPIKFERAQRQFDQDMNDSEDMIDALSILGVSK